MKSRLLLLLLLAFLPVAPTAAKTGDVEWRRYTIPGHGVFSVQAPAKWKQDVRQSDSSLPPTIVLRPKKGDAFELLVTPIYAEGGQPPSLQKLEAAVAEGGARHLAEAQEDSLTIEPLEGEQVSGRFFRLTEREPPPDEFPRVLSGSLVTGPVVASFTLLHRDQQAKYVQQALALLGSARFERGAVGSYRASMDELHLKVLIASAAGLEPEFLVEERKKLRVKLGPYLVDAEQVRRGIRIRVDGPDPERTQKLLKALTSGFPALN